MEQKRKHLEMKYMVNSGTGVIYPLVKKEKDNIDYSQYLQDLVELGVGTESGYPNSRHIEKDFMKKNTNKSSTVAFPMGS